MSDHTKDNAQPSGEGTPEMSSSEPCPVSAEENRSPASKTATPVERELGGPTGPEPTRYGDWEKKGRCIDF